jgi:probable phosphoglycerate mutase
MVGPGKLLDPQRVRRVWVSPRQRAVRTFQLLFGGGAPHPGASEVVVAGVPEGIFGGGAGSVVVTEQIREWDYGEYEGMMAAEVRELRKQRGLETEGGPRWSVWRDGCEGGELRFLPSVWCWRRGGRYVC